MTKFFTKDHEWIEQNSKEATVGITEYAQQALGDVVFVELPHVGQTVKAGDEVAVVESVKAASDVYAPVGGEVTAINEDLPNTPEMVNTDPLGAGWFYKLKDVDEGVLEDLMNAETYKKYTEGLD